MRIQRMLLGLLAICTVATARADVTKSQRALVVVTELDRQGAPELRDLYRGLESATIDFPRALLANQYAVVRILNNNLASKDAFRQTLRGLGANPNIHAIDVILALHGATNRLSFVDGAMDTESLSDFFDVRNNPQNLALTNLTKNKLRLMYSTACFGRSHIDDWLAVGFDAVIGAHGVNANSEAEYPSMLTQWASGQTAFNALAPTNNDIALAATDGPLVATGHLLNNFLARVNSRKAFGGLHSVKINSEPVAAIQTQITP